MTHEFDLEIDDYVDGTLPAVRTVALEAHLAGCSRCRALAADFRALRSAAAALEPHMPPPRTWARIAGAISEAPARPSGLAWLGGLTWRSAIATSLMVVLLAGGTWVSWREVSEGRRKAAAAAAVQGASGSPADSSVEQQMRTQISHMEGIVRTSSSVLPGETKAAYQAGIDDIDSALDSPRAILAEEPTNEGAQQTLFELLQSKLKLLQEMIALINEMRQGNQDEAARIVSEMEK
jgi:anti-sigma factor RsiW